MVPLPAPLTPLGARTPLAHPALYGVIAVLSLVVIAGAAWIFWPRSAVAPQPSASVLPSPSPSPSPSVTASSLEYRNDAYGLSVKLPESWRGYRDVTPGMEWTAYRVTDGSAIDTGPIVTLQHPAWTQSVKRQDIPVMVFTLEQWSHVGSPGPSEWSVSAAPIPPTELARNGSYVFALPARYNYGFLPGWEEVDTIIRGGAVSAFKPCMPRPACLDATPRCLLPEPAEGWCE